MIQTDVIVIGAGMAGLKAAQQLVAHGHGVVVLEAKDRVGGRTRQGSVGGHAADLGGQWMGAGHDVLRAEATRLGLAHYPQYETGNAVLELLGKLTRFTGAVPKMPLLSLVALFRLQKRWARDIRTVPPAAPWTAPRAAEWDAMTLESWIVANVRTRHAREFARLVPRGAWAAEARQVSYLWFLDALRGAGGLDYLMTVKGGALESKFTGGMNAVARGLAAELGERVVLNAPVSKIVQDANGVHVVTAKDEYAGRFLIVTAPPANCARIAFEPPLPAARDGLHQRMPMGAIIKAVVAYKTPFWRANGFSGQVATDDDPLGLVYDDCRDDGTCSLICFFEGRHALEWSDKPREARKARVRQSLIRFFGPEAADIAAYDDNDWLTEPYTHGYVGSMPPGVMTRFGHALRAPVGRIHWAGAETSVEWTGYVEGALRSGIRAAEEVHRHSNA
jgi:monoamine oxidase